MKKAIEIKKISITDLSTDAIVNAANDRLAPGSGVCGAIFDAAGYYDLQKACNAISHCDTGDAVITPGFNLKAKYVIHAVGPIWNDGKHGEPEKLRSAYRKSLELAVVNHCSSIGFSLISAGVFGCPIVTAWQEAFAGCKEFFDSHADTELTVIFAVLNDNIMATGQKILTQYDLKVPLQSNEVFKKPSVTKDSLTIGSQEYDAVFFHKPEEPNGFLSNWYSSPFDIDDTHFTSAEQYIMYRKCIAFGDAVSAKAVLATNDTALQQDIGRHASGYIGSVWAGMRQMVAFEGLIAKFSQNEELKKMLLDTGDAILVECAGSDKIWACGIRLDDNRRFDALNWDGSNILGFTLMRVRDFLKQ